jgi:hypothetical protein
LHGYSGADLAGVRLVLQVGIGVPGKEQKSLKEYMMEVLKAGAGGWGGGEGGARGGKIMDAGAIAPRPMVLVPVTTNWKWAGAGPPRTPHPHPLYPFPA